MLTLNLTVKLIKYKQYYKIQQEAKIFHSLQKMQNTSFNSLQIQPDPQNLPPKKMDILFYQSITRLHRSYTLMALYQSIKALLFIIFIPIDYSIINHPDSSQILGIMIFAFVVSILQTLSVVIFRVTNLSNNRLLLRVAHQLRHVTDETITASINNMQNCVSATIFNQQNGTLITDEGLTEQIKNMYLNYLTPNIKQILVADSPILKMYDYFAEFSGFVSFVASIIVLSKAQSNSAELAVIIVYIVLEGLTKLLVILIGLLIALSPLFCILMVCCVCFCPRQQQGELKLPEVQKATEKMILEADGTCSICYQNFMVEQSVIRLKCSSKHMFHPFCISGWAKLKETCPICRASIRELGNNYRQNQ